MITLKTLPEATAQQVFDQAAEHLLKQNKRSSAPGGGCMYRNENGLKCAAGCFVADDEYWPKMEGGSWDSLAGAGVVTDAHMDLIKHLQIVHDSYNPDLWRVQLSKLASIFNLNTNVLNDNRTII